MNSSVSVLSRPSSVYSTRTYREICDDLELLDANSWRRAEAGDQTEDPDIVEWDGPNDPENPLNWSAGRKWANIITFSTITMIR